MVEARVGAEMKRIVLAGAAHVAAAREVLSPVLAAWAQHWCLGGETNCRVQQVEAGEAAGVCAIGHSVFGDAVLMAGEAAWRQALFGSVLALVPEDATAARIVQAARDALLADVFAALGREGRQQEPMVLPVTAGGQVFIFVMVNRACLWLCLDAQLLDDLVEKPALAGCVDLVPRTAAVASATVELRVEISLIKVEVGEFLGLKVGDIICGEPGLGAAFSVRVGDTILPLRAALGAKDGRKAVRLDK